MENSFTIYNLSQFLFQLCTRFFFERPPHFGLAFVVEFLALGDANLELYTSFLPVNTGYDKRHTLLRGLFYELFDLALMQQELSGPENIVIVDIPMRIVRNMGAEQPNLAVLYLHERLFKLDPARHNALDLRPQQHSSGLVFIENMIFKIRLPIANDLLFIGHTS